MFEHRINSFLHSLRGQYVIVSIIISILLVAGSASTDIYFEQSSRRLVEETRYLIKTLETSNQLLDSLWEIQFLVEMNAVTASGGFQQKISQRLMDAEKLLLKLLSRQQNIEQKKLLTTSYESLGELKTEVKRLLEIRQDPAQLYPVIQISRSEMLDNQRAFSSLIERGLNESLFVATENSEVLILLMNMRHKWGQMVSGFRMYLVNRVAAVAMEQLVTQAADIEIYYRELVRSLKLLRQLDKQELLEFQVSDSLDDMEKFSSQWYGIFRKIMTETRAENWRADYPLVKNSIGPLMGSAWYALHEFDRSIGKQLQNNIIELSNTGATTSGLLWLLTASGMLGLFIFFYFIRVRLLRPIEQITRAMQHEARKDFDVKDIPNQGISEETDNLIEAFSYLQLQVRLRENQLEHQALHDALTGLPNRLLLFDRLEQSIEKSRRDKEELILIMLDLNRFKEINDTLGHAVGDELLIRMAERLTSVLRSVDTVARLGGDEFAILVPSCDTNQAVKVATKILESMKPAVQLGDRSLYLGVSMGISSYPEHGNDASELMKFADVAMYFAKRMNSGFEIYHQHQNMHDVDRLSIKQAMQKAYHSNEFELHYQPQIDLMTGEIAGVEALIRWGKNGDYQLPPDVFIPLAEESGLIKQITEWVIRETICQQEKWKKEGLVIRSSINLSAWNLLDPDLESFILDQFARYAVDRSMVSFEITESAMMSDTEKALKIMQNISDFGLDLIIDDYGTGFSSLAYIKKFPVNELKIDKSFVMNMIESENDAIIVKSTIDLAHNLELKVLAEGVENHKTLELLRKLGCDRAQGYYISYPLRADELSDWVHNYCPEKIFE